LLPSVERILLAGTLLNVDCFLECAANGSMHRI
jgi:hypothetical protein